MLNYKYIEILSSAGNNGKDVVYTHTISNHEHTLLASKESLQWAILVKQVATAYCILIVSASGNLFTHITLQWVTLACEIYANALLTQNM